jgi:ureidoglycolate hydrolase
MTRAELRITMATTDNVGPYGGLVDSTSRSADFVSDAFSYWDALAVEAAGRGLSVGMVEARPSDLVGREFERHLETAELLVPLDGDVVLVLGAPTGGPLPDPARFAAIRLPRGQAVLLHPGTWHYAPLSESGVVHVLVAFASGTSDSDKDLHDVANELGVEFVAIP